MTRINNSELVILQTISEKPKLSGYEIDKIIKERGFSDWAGVSTVSIYRGLKALEEKGFINSEMQENKKITGPLPKLFFLTKIGKKNLIQNILEALSSIKSLDRRFDLGIAGMIFCSSDQVKKALNKRIDLISERIDFVENKYLKQGGDKLPPHVQHLFNHSLFLLKNEKKFTRDLIINEI